MKCDEMHPACSMCTNAGLQCGGYKKSIFFEFKGPPDACTTRFRRPLFSEEERVDMSEWLTSTVPPGSVMQKLSWIDKECEEASPSTDVNLICGPFGVFKSRQNQAFLRDNLPDWLDETLYSQDILHLTDDNITASLTPRTQQLFDTVLDPPEQNLVCTSRQIWDNTEGLIRFQEIFDNLGVAMSLPELQSPTLAPTMMHTFSFPPQRGNDTLSEQLGASEFISSPSTIENRIPHDAVFLIKHYSTIILTLLTPFRHNKTPWHILFVPHAKNCLAALTLGEDLDHASLCAFYATLSVSAYSLGGVSQSCTWVEQGNTYLRIAREHVRLMIKTAYDYSKTAKYKCILIALLNMVQVAMVTGNHDQAECYFIEAEKFIRVKGLNRRKSRKVRLLHHCYVFERMFHESTFLGGTNSNHRRHARKAIESSGAGIYSQDSLSFRLGNWSDLDKQMMKIKGQEEGENDLHLQLPGMWPNTLYPEIFGIPENYMFALSLVIRLGQWKDDALREDEAEAPRLKEFVTRAKIVERYIKQLRHASHSAENMYNKQTNNPEPSLNEMLNTMQNALAIYYYRRIHDVDASMLQPQVIRVRDNLLRFESAGPGMMNGFARLLWPAFIAACEAEDPEVQTSFSQWFKDAMLRSGLRYFEQAKEDVERIWEERRNAHGSYNI